MKIIVFLIALAVLGEAFPAHKKRHLRIPKRRMSLGCATIGENCSVKPCCDYYTAGNFNFGRLICFQFGVKVCRTDRSILNRREYFRLLYQLNGTNHQEMRDRYWLSLQPTAPPPPTPKTVGWSSRILRFGR